MEDCGICFCGITETKYVIIDNPGEKGKYHLDCLVEWLTLRKNGIETQTPIETYSIFENDLFIKQIKAETHYSELRVFWEDVTTIELGNDEDTSTEEESSSFENFILSILFICI
jgi:hypothetical protein